jgi:dephospho-CoA kinase
MINETGKSTISNLISNVNNISIIDLDILARKAVEPNSYALSKIINHFGTQILNNLGQLDRDKLGQIIFANQNQRKLLNKIVHPAVRRLLLWELIKCWFKGDKIVVVDAPLLIEAGLWKLCAVIVVVYW